MVGFHEPEWSAPLSGFSRDACVYQVVDELSPAGTSETSLVCSQGRLIPNELRRLESPFLIGFEPQTITKMQIRGLHSCVRVAKV
jgi:hypothetical protein